MFRPMVEESTFFIGEILSKNEIQNFKKNYEAFNHQKLKNNFKKSLDFYTYFKWVVKIIKRCLNIFILIFHLFPNLAKSSYG
jgi:hypothetical protein